MITPGNTVTPAGTGRNSPFPRLRLAGVVAGLLAVPTIVAACGYITPADPDPAPPPVEGRDLTTWLVSTGTDGSHELYVRNDSDRVYRITSVRLTDCLNVRECGTSPIDVVLCPGETRRAFAAHPFGPNHRIERERAFFKWDYRSTRYEPGEPVVGADCGGTE